MLQGGEGEDAYEAVAVHGGRFSGRRRVRNVHGFEPGVEYDLGEIYAVMPV